VLTGAEVYEVPRGCYDREIPVNIVDLGLVYGVTLEVEGRRGQRGDEADGAGMLHGRDVTNDALVVVEATEAKIEQG